MNQTNFKKILITILLITIVFGCRNLNTKYAVCNNVETTITYREKDYKRLLKTKNCYNCQLNGNQIDLSNLNLSEANLVGTELAGAKLRGTNLKDANLSFVVFDNYDGGFFGTGVRCIADLEGTNLHGLIFVELL